MCLGTNSPTTQNVFVAGFNDHAQKKAAASATALLLIYETNL